MACTIGPIGPRCRLTRLGTLVRQSLSWVSRHPVVDPRSSALRRGIPIGRSFAFAQTKWYVGTNRIRPGCDDPNVIATWIKGYPKLN
jgi:hypothetical protein